jgi:hypothetical protein
LNLIAYKCHSLSLKNITISCCSIALSVLAMPFSASIARNILRVCSVNRAAREAVVSATEAILREIGREVTMMLREVIMAATESKSNRTIYKDLLEPSTRISRRIVSDQNSTTSVEFFAKRRTLFHKSLNHFIEVDYIVLSYFLNI